MEDINTLKQKAIELRSSKDYKGSLEIYEVLWKSHRHECNCWDGWGYAYCLRKNGQSSEALDVCRTLYKMDSNFSIGKDLYGWCIFDLNININNEEIVNNEKQFFKAVSAILSLTEQSKFSPFSKTIFKAASYLNSRLNVNYEEIVKFLRKLTPDQLPIEPLVYDDNGSERVITPERENWYLSITKALFKSEQYDECLSLCSEALSKIEKFHHGNDIWIKWRLALSKSKLGSIEESIDLLKDVLAKKNDWFVQFELSKLYYRNGQIDKAYENCINAALNRGQIEYKWKLFWHLSKILKDKDKNLQAEMHLFLVKLIIEKNGWKLDQKLKDEIDSIALDHTYTLPDIINNLKKFWESERFSNTDILKGKIIKVLHHGKAGFIKANDGNSYYFQARNISFKKDSLSIGKTVNFSLIDSYDKKRKKKTKEAVNIITN